MSAASTLASLHTVSWAGVVVASRLLRFEARHATTVGSASVTTGGGIGLRSGLEAGLETACPRADLRVAPPACLGLAASILSLLTGSVRLPLEGCRWFTTCRSDSAELRRARGSHGGGGSR